MSPRSLAIAEPLLQAVKARVGFLIDVGLDYLALDRSAQTLSSGEGQRIRLATQIGAALVGVLYVLDEPSVGLHARDNARLIEAQTRPARPRQHGLRGRARPRGHPRRRPRRRHGPGRRHPRRTEWSRRGRPPRSWPTRRPSRAPTSPGRRSSRSRPRDARPARRSVSVKGARAHNLKDIDVDIPVGLFTCITGVSGSGKSSLIVDTLLPARARAALLGDRRGRRVRRDRRARITWTRSSPSTRRPSGAHRDPTPRPTPASSPSCASCTPASLRHARAATRPVASRSTSRAGVARRARATACLRVEMHFLPDVFVTCDTCEGKRYNRETLEVKYRGLSIADALALNIDEAYERLRRHPSRARATRWRCARSASATSRWGRRRRRCRAARRSG